MRLEEKEMPGAVGAADRADVDNARDAIVCDPAQHLKAILMARAARAGISVHESFGGYIVGQGALHEVPDLRTLSRCLSSMGVTA